MQFIREILSLLEPKQKLIALVIMLLMIVGMFLEMLSIGLVVPAIVLLLEENIAVSYPQASSMLELLGNPSKEELLTIGLIGLVAVYVIKSLFLGFLAWRQSSFAFGVGANLSEQLFKRYLDQPYIFHLQRNSAELIRNITTEVHHFTSTLSQFLVIISESLVIVGIATLFMVVEPVGSLIAILTLIVFSWFFQNITKNRIKDWAESRQIDDGLRIQYLQQGLGGVKDAKILGREEEFIRQFAKPNTELGLLGRNMQTVQALPRLWLELLAVIGLTSLVMVMMSQYQDLQDMIPILGLFAAGAFRLMPSSNRIISSVQHLRFAGPVVRTLAQEYYLEASQSEVISKENITFQNLIELKDLSFLYPNSSGSAIDNINIKINKGESIGIIGESGSGKSTLIDVILGLLDPSTGEVLVDNVNIQSNKRSWQNKVGYVPQTIFLNDESLKRNIAFGLSDENIDDNIVLKIIEAAQLEDYVASLPQGLDTPLGERGVRMSGGQRQRIGIARALYHDPDVLVLDEATSSLDNATEKEVMRAIDKMKGEKTILIVAHRLSTVENTDRLIHLDKGKLLKEGAYQEMIDRH